MGNFCSKFSAPKRTLLILCTVAPQSLQRVAIVKMILFDRKRRKLPQTPTLVVRLEAQKVSVLVEVNTVHKSQYSCHSNIGK